MIQKTRLHEQNFYKIVLKTLNLKLFLDWSTFLNKIKTFPSVVTNRNKINCQLWSTYFHRSTFLNIIKNFQQFAINAAASKFRNDAVRLNRVVTIKSNHWLSWIEAPPYKNILDQNLSRHTFQFGWNQLSLIKCIPWYNTRIVGIDTNRSKEFYNLFGVI